MKKLCESLRQHAIKMISFISKIVKLLTNEKQESYGNAKLFYIKKEKEKYAKNGKYCKVRDHFHYNYSYN